LGDDRAGLRRENEIYGVDSARFLYFINNEGFKKYLIHYLNKINHSIFMAILKNINSGL
jgi:hypothetical protein